MCPLHTCAYLEVHLLYFYDLVLMMFVLGVCSALMFGGNVLLSCIVNLCEDEDGQIRIVEYGTGVIVIHQLCAQQTMTGSIQLSAIQNIPDKYYR